MILRILLALAAFLAVPAFAQTPCAPPAAASNGLVPQQGHQWNGRSWSIRAGMVWNKAVPHAVCLGDNYARFELRDTPNDRGPNDAAKKRRAEIGTDAGYRNGTTYWVAYSFKLHVEGINTKLGNTLDQFQDPEGSSPSISHRIVACSASSSRACLRTTTRVSGDSTISRGEVPISLDTPHDLVMRFQMGALGFQETYLDGKLVSSYRGVIGSTRKDGYGLRIGAYGAPLGGMTLVWEYRNLTPLASTADLSARIAAPPTWG